VRVRTTGPCARTVEFASPSKPWCFSSFFTYPREHVFVLFLPFSRGGNFGLSYLALDPNIQVLTVQYYTLASPNINHHFSHPASPIYYTGITSTRLEAFPEQSPHESGAELNERTNEGQVMLSANLLHSIPMFSSFVSLSSLSFSLSIYKYLSFYL